MDEFTSSGWHVETMSGILRAYPNLATAKTAPVARGKALREVSFGSDLDGKSGRLALLPIEPLSARGEGCDLAVSS